jgi:hypothetical protein
MIVWVDQPFGQAETRPRLRGTERIWKSAGGDAEESPEGLEREWVGLLLRRRERDI